MATLKIEITAPNAALDNYADELGYQAKILENAVIIDNPQSKVQFLTEKLRTILAQKLAEPTLRSFEAGKQDDVRAEKARVEAAIEGVMTVTVT